jgi:hypothetical protein
MPDHWAPGTVGIGAVVGRSEHTVLRLDVRDAFPRGLYLKLRGYLSPDGPALDDMFIHRSRGAEGTIRLGLLWPDGSRLEADQRWATHAERRPGEPSLDVQGQGGGGLRWAWRVWLHPLPQPGPVTVYCRWDERDIAETATVLDLTAAVEAAASAEELWHLPRFDEQAPEGGWFAYAPLGGSSAYGSTSTVTADGEARDDGSGDALDRQDENG